MKLRTTITGIFQEDGTRLPESKFSKLLEVNNLDRYEFLNQFKKFEVDEELRILTKNPDQVNHPSHYGGINNPYEAIKIIEAVGLGFHLGNALKYLIRAGKKDPNKKLEDLKKAVFYINREIENHEKINTTT